MQNRVDPYGNIIETSARGHWMGNRGILHNEHQKIIRPYKLKAWLTCLLQFNGRKRTIMSPRRYTELFFWDEATAFAAGHRPCFECRRNDFNRFKAFWIVGNAGHGFDLNTSINEFDKILHRERLTPGGAKAFYEADINALPNGCFIEFNNKPHVILKGLMFPWSPFGYGKGIACLPGCVVKVLTPKSIVNTFIAGYSPQVVIPG
jgi:hypothetical protein